MRLLSYNIRYGGTGREKAIAGVINACEPDIVILEEATNPDVVKQLASACGMGACASVHGHSLAFLSRRKPAFYTWHRIRFARRRYLELIPDETQMRIYGVHLSAIHSNVTELRRTYELRSLLRHVPDRQQFHVLTGDFNTLAPGEDLDVGKLPPRLRAIVWMTGRHIRWRTIKLMLDRGYADAYRAFHKDDGYSFPTWAPHVRLDYTFVPAVFAPRVTRCEIVREAPGVRQASDHFPLLTELDSK